MIFILLLLVLLTSSSCQDEGDDSVSTFGPQPAFDSGKVGEASAIIYGETASCVEALFYDGLNDVLEALITSVDAAVAIAEQKGCELLAKYLATTGKFG